MKYSLENRNGERSLTEFTLRFPNGFDMTRIIILSGYARNLSPGYSFWAGSFSARLCRAGIYVFKYLDARTRRSSFFEGHPAVQRWAVFRVPRNPGRNLAR